MIEGFDILCLASQDWDSHLGVPQQIAARLAERNRLIYVNPPRSVLGAVGMAMRPAAAHALHRDVAAARQVIVVDPPPITAPVFNVPPTVGRVLGQANGVVLGTWLRRLLRSCGFKQPLLWVYSVPGAQVLGHVDARAVVYDCIDEWAGYHAVNSRPWLNTSRMDEALCRGADIVFAGATHLLGLKRPFNPETYLVRHAANFANFHRAASADLPVASAVANLPGPVIGMVGVLDKRLDLGILGHLARARPHWSIVLAGPVYANVDLSALQALPNVHLLGMLSVSDMPAYIKGFDACLIPYVIDDFTLNIYPLKLHEYLASGRPVVTTRIPACVEHADVVEIAEGAEAFLGAVEHALADRNPARDAARIAVARQNTWEARVEEKSALITAMLARRGAAARIAA